MSDRPGIVLAGPVCETSDTTGERAQPGQIAGSCRLVGTGFDIGWGDGNISAASRTKGLLSEPTMSIKSNVHLLHSNPVFCA